MKVAIVLCPPEQVTEGTGGITWAFRLVDTFSRHSDVEILPIVNKGVAKLPKLEMGTYRGLKALMLTHPIHLPGISEAEYRRLGISCPKEMIDLKRLIKEALIKEHIDLIHMMDWSRVGIGLVCLQVANELGIPIIYIANDYQSICIRSFMQYREIEPCSGPESAHKCATCFNEARSLSLLERIVRFGLRTAQIRSPRMAILATLVLGRFVPHSRIYEMTNRFEGYILSRQRSIREALQGCRRIMFGPGDEQQEIILKWTGLPSKKALRLPRVAPPLPPPDFQKDEDTFHHPLKVTFLGRSWPGWGIQFLLQAWKELEISPNLARLFVYTSPGFRRTLQSYSVADLLDTPGIEVYEGPVFHMLDQIHRQSALHVIASQWQDLGSQVGPEAMVRKTPLIVPDQFETRHYVKEGVTGFHYRWRDLNSFKQVLAAAISDPGRLETMSRQISTPDYGWDEFVRYLVGEYRKALSVKFDA